MELDTRFAYFVINTVYIEIPIKNVGVASVQAKSNKHSHCFKLIRVEKRFIENTIFVIVEKENLNQPTYLIENWSKYVSLIVFQQWASNTVYYIDVMEKMPYGVINPNTNTNTIVWQFFVGSLQRNPQFVEDTEFKIDMEVMDREDIIKIPTGFCQGKILYMKTYTDRSTYNDVEDEDTNLGNITKYMKFIDTFEEDVEENEEVNMIIISRVICI